MTRDQRAVITIKGAAKVADVSENIILQQLRAKNLESVERDGELLIYQDSLFRALGKEVKL